MPRFITAKWIEVHDQSGKIYNITKKIGFKTSMLQSDQCDYSDAYIAVKGIITVKEDDNRNIKNRQVFSISPFISCISKVNNVSIYNAEDFGVVMLTYNLIQYSKNHIKATDRLWKYYRYEHNNTSFNRLTVNYNADPTINTSSFK